MRFDLAAMARRAGTKRRLIPFRPILTTAAQHRSLGKINDQVMGPWYRAAAAIRAIYAAELQRRLAQDSIDDLTSLFAALSDEVESLILDLTPDLRNWALGIETWHRGKWARTILAGANVDISTLIGPQDNQESIEAFMARNTALIRNVSDETRGKVADAVYRGLQRRVPTADVAKAITATLDGARKRAERIAADQATKLAAAFDAERQRQAGLTVWKWRHSGKLHFRPAHKARDGNLYADDPADRGTGPNGEEILMPPEDDDLPGVPPFCGCVRQGVLLLPGIAV